MIKSLLSKLISFILLILITTLCFLLIIRHFLFTDALNEMVSQTISSTANASESLFSENFTASGIPKEVIEYIENEEAADYASDYLTIFIKYLIGIEKQPKLNNDKLKEIIDEAVIEYEKEYNQKVNTETFYTIIDEFDKNLEQESREIRNSKEVSKLLKLITNQTIIYLLIAGIVLCFLIIFIINKNIITALKNSAISLTINGIGLKAIGSLIGAIGNNTDESVSKLAEILSKQINKSAYINLIAAIVILLLAHLYKKAMEEKQKNSYQN